MMNGGEEKSSPPRKDSKMKTLERYRCQLVRDGSVEYMGIVRDCSDAANIILQMGFDNMSEEYFGMLCLNVKGEIISYHEISHGELAATNCHPREIYKRALLNNAAAIIVFHNHPSGDTTPSDDDIISTRRISDAGKLIGIQLIDHIIVGEGSYCSLKVEGVLN